MFLRHVGKHGDRKVAVVFREVPGESHMALVVYTELLNQNIHDPMMTTIEGDIGQNSEHLADALNRTYTKDGRQILQVLHGEGLLKKVNTEQIIMTPSPSQKIKLNELNKILDEMKLGEDAVKKLAEMDASLGLQDPRDVARRMRGDKEAAQKAAKGVVAGGDALGDAALANNLRQQAAKMSNEAKGLLAEAARLEKEAASLDPVKVVAPKAKKAKAKNTKVDA
jgi:hypothetical protein